jgi:hypothetical protein
MAMLADGGGGGEASSTDLFLSLLVRFQSLCSYFFRLVFLSFSNLNFSVFSGMKNEFFFAIPKRKVTVTYEVPGVSDGGPNIRGQII